MPVVENVQAVISQRLTLVNTCAEYRYKLASNDSTEHTLKGCIMLARFEDSILKTIKPADSEIITAREKLTEDITAYKRGLAAPTQHTENSIFGLVNVLFPFYKVIRQQHNELKAVDSKTHYMWRYKVIRTLCGIVLFISDIKSNSSAGMRLKLNVATPIKQILDTLKDYEHRNDTGKEKSNKGGSRARSGRKPITGAKRYSFTLTPLEHEKMLAYLKQLRED